MFSGMRKRSHIGLLLILIFVASPLATVETAACGQSCVRAEVMAAPPQPAAPGRWALDLAWWFAVVTGGTGFAVSLLTGHRQRRGPVDIKIHEERIKQYQAMVTNTAPLAIYFPVAGGNGKSRLTPDACAKMGQAASSWYFAHGGNLMSGETRDAYMRFARGLTAASLSNSLAAPEYPADSVEISDDRLNDYREKLLNDVAPEMASKAAEEPPLPWLKSALSWLLDQPNPQRKKIARMGYALASSEVVKEYKFGVAAAKDAPAYQRFRDYVFLQNLSSKLRTALAEDLRSRRRPE
jgi:hypothetical protein